MNASYTQAPAEIRCKRVYNDPSPSDGYRVLVDRFWPRGVKKEELAVEEWCKALSPSSELRKWFRHEPQRWEGFCQRYHAELKEHGEELEALLDRCDGRTLTLVYSARDPDHNNALALKMFLEEQQRHTSRAASGKRQ
jgi:uncharacterized protein YeaO (DUF488 family)